MNDNRHRAIVVIGGEDLDEATFAAAQGFDEVFVLARAVPDRDDGWVTDDDRDRARAQGRLTRALAHLRAHGIRALGTIGDENAAAARDDALALFPGADAVFA